MSDVGLDLGIVGTRGIPGNYGGFETFAERLGIGLVNRGHRVTVYCPKSYSKVDTESYQGIRRILVPNIPSKSLDKLTSAFASTLLSCFQRHNAVLFLGVSPVMLGWLPKLFGKGTVINIDGVEWRRTKWSWTASAYLKFSEKLSGLVCDRVVADSREIQRYYKEAYGRDSVYIAYGADVGTTKAPEVLEKYGLAERQYLLQVCRFEPENNAHIVVREYAKLATDIPLVILGNAPYADEYILRVKQSADSRVRFLGAVYGQDYDVLRSNALCYVHAHEVGGTNPALLEALAAGNFVLALDVPFNTEVVADAGLTFSKTPGDLAAKLTTLLDGGYPVEEMRRRAVQRIEECYTWERIIEEYEALLREVVVPRRN